MATNQATLTGQNTNSETEDGEFVPDRFDVEGASYERNDGHTWLIDLPEPAGENREIESAGITVEKGGFSGSRWVVTLAALDADHNAIHGGFLQPGSQVLSEYQTETKAVKNATALIERLVDGEYGDVIETND